jgi:MFS transporter, PAT family, beta-lactamase induction signal transducer AmpG
MSESAKKTPWYWVPSLYAAEGIPYALTTSVSVVLYKSLGVDNAQIGLYTSLLGLPWVVKPLWGPVVDLLGTRRQWIWLMQLFIGAVLAGMILALPLPHFFALTLALFWLLALASATHDIAADGFYLLGLPEREQSLFSGVRNTFYRVANITVQGGLVYFAGMLQQRTGNAQTAWLLTLAVAAGLMLLLGLYHRWILPRPVADAPRPVAGHFLADFAATFISFFQKPQIGTMLAFVLTYRLGEAQLVKMAQPFLLDARTAGGLGLGLKQVAVIYGTAGVCAALLGGLLGGVLVARHGLKFWLWPMLLAIHLPDAVFIWLAQAQPQNVYLIGSGVVLEQFGYGFGFMAFMLYLLRMARGTHATAHYALCTGFMALGMMVPGLWSGWLQEWLGYRHFFIWVLLATIPSFYLATRIPLEADYGRRRQD